MEKGKITFELFFLVVLLLLFFSTSCQRHREKYLQFIPHDIKTLSITGKTIAEWDDSGYFYDMTLSAKTLSLLKRHTDTILYQYSLADLSLLHSKLKDKWQSPAFVKSNTRYPTKDNEILVVDDQALQKIVIAKNGELQTESLGESKVWGNASNFNLTSRTAYGVPVLGRAPYTHFSNDETNGYVWFKPSPEVVACLGDEENIPYTGILALHEKKDVAVFAFRFLNAIQFYKSGKKEKLLTIYGDSIQPPLHGLGGKLLDMHHSPKHFIDIYGTNQYVYCLYSGSPDFMANTKIIIYNWNGKHIRTLQTDMPLSKIVVDTKNSYLLGLAPKRPNGQKLIQYDLSSF